MKKIFTFSILTYLLFAINISAISESLNKNNSKDEKILKVGILLPLSGEHQDIGESFLKAIQLALYDISNEQIKEWPNYDKLKLFDKDKIYYARVNNKKYLERLFNLVNTKNKNGLLKHPIPPDQWSIAGGFFIIYKR